MSLLLIERINLASCDTEGQLSPILSPLNSHTPQHALLIGGRVGVKRLKHDLDYSGACLCKRLRRVAHPYLDRGGVRLSLAWPNTGTHVFQEELRDLG